MVLEPGIESVAIFTMDGEPLDIAGKNIDYHWVRDLATIINMIAARVGGAPQRLEIDLGGRKIVMIVDPPLIRVGMVVERRK